MSGARHTPGPWQAYVWATSADAVDLNQTPFVVTYPHPVDSLQESDANARLIAAAPDLLAFAKAHEAWEALLIWEGDWDSTKGGLPTFTQEIYEGFTQLQTLRNAAIAKTKG